MAKLLLVEDEPSIREVLTRYLQRAGYEIVACADGGTGLKKALEAEVELVILDLMLPDMDGIEICRRLRQVSSVPILILTARDESEGRILGFGVGADDYVTKPFVPLEIVLRVKAILSRVNQSTRLPSDGQRFRIVLQDLVLDHHSRTVTLAGVPVDLTAKEFNLLWTLAEHAGQVLSRSQLLARVWQYDEIGDSSTVTVHIRRLREKIERDPSNPKRILTVWGHGYRLQRGNP